LPEKAQNEVVSDIEKNVPVVVYLSRSPGVSVSGQELIDDYISGHYAAAKKLEITPSLYRFFDTAVIMEPNRDGNLQ
jgi:hypothetical protein